jgi:hypothetical protein
MVGVVMGGQGTDQAHPVGLNDTEDLVDGIGRVHDHGVAGPPVADQVDEVDHLPGDGVVDGEVPAGQ